MAESSNYWPVIFIPGSNWNLVHLLLNQAKLKNQEKFGTIERNLIGNRKDKSLFWQYKRLFLGKKLKESRGFIGNMLKRLFVSFSKLYKRCR